MKLAIAGIALMMFGCTIDPCQMGECNARININCVEIVLPTGVVEVCQDAGAQPVEAGDEVTTQSVAPGSAIGVSDTYPCDPGAVHDPGQCPSTRPVRPN